jgi:hypothetical protein
MVNFTSRKLYPRQSSPQYSSGMSLGRHQRLSERDPGNRTPIPRLSSSWLSRCSDWTIPTPPRTRRVSCEDTAEVTVMVKHSSWYSDVKWSKTGNFVSYKRSLTSWDCLIWVYLRFEWTCCFHLQGQRVSEGISKLGFLQYYSHFPIHSSQSVQCCYLNWNVDEASLNMLRRSS